MFAIGVGYYWQIFVLAYAYGFRGLGELHNNPMFELRYAYPDLAANYRFLSGLAVLLPSAVVGIFMGAITDTTNRVRLLGVASILWSLSTFTSGEVDSFEVFSSMRLCLGIFTAACIPPAVSLIRDYFPPAYRSQANSIFLASNYIGCCISSLSILFIKNYGWREDYEITGIFGILAGVAVLINLQEPVRGKWEEIQKERD